MAKSNSLAELRPHTRAGQGEGKIAKQQAAGTLTRRAKAAAGELSTLPLKPLLIGVGIGAALLGSALAVSSRRPSVRTTLNIQPTLAKTALIALARVVSGQTVRTVATSALLDVAEALKG